ncbi:MAG: hypothetical protein PHO57_02975 [Acidithiobacillus sp.]|nr:hypothetical protein [Acidithiobacillus sp.]
MALSMEEKLKKIEERQMTLERQKQKLLHGDAMGGTEDRKAFLKAMEANDGFGFTWVDVLSLVQICQGQVPEQAVANRGYAQGVMKTYAPKPRKKKDAPAV